MSVGSVHYFLLKRAYVYTAQLLHCKPLYAIKTITSDLYGKWLQLVLVMDVAFISSQSKESYCMIKK